MKLSISSLVALTAALSSTLTTAQFDTTNPVCGTPFTNTTTTVSFHDCYRAWKASNWTQPTTYDKCDEPDAEVWNSLYGAYGSCQLWATSAFGKANCMHLAETKKLVKSFLVNCTSDGKLNADFSGVWWPDREKGGQYFYVKKV